MFSEGNEKSEELVEVFHDISSSFASSDLTSKICRKEHDFTSSIIGIAHSFVIRFHHPSNFQILNHPVLTTKTYDTTYLQQHHHSSYFIFTKHKLLISSLSSVLFLHVPPSILLYANQLHLWITSGMVAKWEAMLMRFSKILPLRPFECWNEWIPEKPLKYLHEKMAVIRIFVPHQNLGED